MIVNLSNWGQLDRGGGSGQVWENGRIPQQRPSEAVVGSTERRRDKLGLG